MMIEVTATKVGLLSRHLHEGLSKTNQKILSLDNLSQQKFETGMFRKQDKNITALDEVFL
jgi:hypothetical protein